MYKNVLDVFRGKVPESKTQRTAERCKENVSTSYGYGQSSRDIDCAVTSMKITVQGAKSTVKEFGIVFLFIDRIFFS
jgi:hypothetical protein